MAVIADRARRVGLPPRPFLYTLDQVSTMLNIGMPTLRSYLYYLGRSVGPQGHDEIQAVNIAKPSQDPDWRVSEGELIRWMKHKRFRYYERGYLDDSDVRRLD